MLTFTIAPRSTISTQGRSRHTLKKSCFEFFNRIGNNRPVELTFQFLLVGRLAIELNGRYSASKMMTALAQPGHHLPLAVTFGFFASNQSERLLFGKQVEGENFRTRPSAARGAYI